MKKTAILFSVVVSMMLFASHAKADIPEGQFHFTPRIGYIDVRAENTDNALALGGNISYQWLTHEALLGLVSSSHDVDNSTSDVKSSIWLLGYKHHFPADTRAKGGHFTAGLDLASHKIKYMGEKWSKVGINANVGYEWDSKWLVETSYLFAGSDDLGLVGTADDVDMGGWQVTVGYKF